MHVISPPAAMFEQSHGDLIASVKEHHDLRCGRYGSLRRSSVQSRCFGSMRLGIQSSIKIQVHRLKFTFKVPLHMVKLAKSIASTTLRTRATQVLRQITILVPRGTRPLQVLREQPRPQPGRRQAQPPVSEPSSRQLRQKPWWPRVRTRRHY